MLALLPRKDKNDEVRLPHKKMPHRGTSRHPPGPKKKIDHFLHFIQMGKSNSVLGGCREGRARTELRRHQERKCEDRRGILKW